MVNTLDQGLDALAAMLSPRIESLKARQFGLDRYGIGMKHDVDPVSPIEVGYSHGPRGLFTFPGVDPVMFNAVIGANSILGQIPAVGTLFTNPTYYTLTGVTSDTGNEKEDVCDDAPVAGLMKACLTTSVFGRYERATQQLEINRLGQRVDRADPMDLRLVGSPLAMSGIFGQGVFDPNNPTDLLINEVSRKFWERNVSFHRLLSQQLWTGNPANNSVGGGYKELTSLSVLVNTGYVDAETNTACEAMDSYMSDFAYQRVDAAGSSLVAAITNMYYQVKDRALRTGMNPVRWMFAMKPQLFYEITAIWPCSYLSYRCNLSGNATEFIDAQDAVRFRDEMRSGRYLLIDGERVEVVLDDGIPELDGNDSGGNFPSGCFATDIYLLPMSVVGGQASLYLEYFQYTNPSIQDALGKMILAQIEGPFITWPRQTNLCIQWQSKVEPRLVLRTPWLASRLQHVVYCPTQHVRDAFPEDPYYVDGGVTSRQGPSFYNGLW